MKTLGIAITAFVLTGCATPMKTQVSRLENAHVCCSSVSEFKFEEIPLGEFIEFKMDESKPVYSFDGVNSYFIALKTNGALKRLSFKSYFNGMLIGQYFQPIVLVLDEQYRVLEERPVRLRYTRPGWSDDDHMVGATFFEENNNAKYIIVHSMQFSDEAPVANVPGSTSVYMAGKIPIVVPSSGHQIELDRSPTGRLKLKVD